VGTARSAPLPTLSLLLSADGLGLSAHVRPGVDHGLFFLDVRGRRPVEPVFLPAQVFFVLLLFVVLALRQGRRSQNRQGGHGGQTLQDNGFHDPHGGVSLAFGRTLSEGGHAAKAGRTDNDDNALRRRPRRQGAAASQSGAIAPDTPSNAPGSSSAT